MAAITSNGTGGGLFNNPTSWIGKKTPNEGDIINVQNGDTITIDQAIDIGTCPGHRLAWCYSI